MEQPSNPEKSPKRSNFLVQALREHLTSIRYWQIEQLTHGFPNEGTRSGRSDLTVVEVVKNAEGMIVTVKREEARGLTGCDLEIEVMRSESGKIRDIRSKEVEFSGEEPIGPPRVFNTLSDEPDTLPLSKVVAGLRQAHQHFKPIDPNLTS